MYIMHIVYAAYSPSGTVKTLTSKCKLLDYYPSTKKEVILSLLHQLNFSIEALVMNIHKSRTEMQIFNN